MAVVIEGDNIISALGGTTAENLKALYEGKGAPFTKIEGGKTLTELIEQCVETAVNQIGRSILSAKGTLFIFSTTKGVLGEQLWQTAERVRRYFGNPNRPVVISNACISGAVAVTAAKRYLQAALYERVIVVGADMISEFVTSGFESFKALSPVGCRPFDKDRRGLNLGEAVGCLILKRTQLERTQDSDSERIMGFKEPLAVMGCAVSNDANHISGPSRTGEGLYRAILRAFGNAGVELAQDEGFINPHGTATLYNDQMESVAIERANLLRMRVMPLKGYYGHTLGAAGVIEIILSAHFLDKGLMPKALGYNNPGTEPALNIIKDGGVFKGKWFLKMISGFGGTNAAVIVVKVSQLSMGLLSERNAATLTLRNTIEFSYQGDVRAYLDGLYRQKGINYPKFHKMDLLCKAGIIAMHDLLGEPDAQSEYTNTEDIALIFMNRSGCDAADREYGKTITKENYFPSPALFVYTLPSIVIGEICIRYKIYGEGAFFISERLRSRQIMPYVKRIFMEKACKRAVLCWCEAVKGRCDVRAALVEAK